MAITISKIDASIPVNCTNFYAAVVTNVFWITQATHTVLRALAIVAVASLNHPLQQVSVLAVVEKVALEITARSVVTGIMENGAFTCSLQNQPQPQLPQYQLPPLQL